MSFFNLYTHDFIRCAVAVPQVRVADPGFNVERTIELMQRAAEERAVLCVFPELGLSAYSCEDLFHQDALLDAVLSALQRVVEASRSLALVAVVGLPLRVDGQLFNCAAVVSGGKLHGLVPKSYLPNYREFYELRQFAPAARATRTSVELCGQREVPFGSKIVFEFEEFPLFKLFVEICEDLWTPIPPSSLASLAGATVIANLSASNITIGKADYRRQLAASQSARCIAAYLYSAAGAGESTTDLAWDGHAMIFEDGTRLAESERFARTAQLVTADVDLGRLAQDRMRTTSFGQASERHAAELRDFRRVRIACAKPVAAQLELRRVYERFPYVPSDPATRDERCREVYEIQVHGLVKRLEAMRAKKVVIGISGGLDSTQALIVSTRAMERLGLPRANVLAYTMPGFATSARTLDQAMRLMRSFGVASTTIDIKPSCMQMLRDIGHPFAAGEERFDVTFENVQAGERTSHLFRLANLHDAPVVGTGDLSELALGWCTYGVGDHMSHYNVNASVPKTLIQFLIRYVARQGDFGSDASRALLDVLDTEISPELVPAKSGAQSGQRTEDFVGPYELVDFHLYYTLRFGYAPTKIAFLAWNAWRDASRGRWPEIPENARHAYELAEIKKWLGVFVKRFFGLSQFKRSALPNGPKVGSGGSLSPRGDWRAPSDGEAAAWLADWERIPDRA